MKVADSSYPVMTGRAIRWDGARSSQMERVRENQGIKIGDIGLVVGQSCSELEVLINGCSRYFQISEVSLVQNNV